MIEKQDSENKGLRSKMTKHVGVGSILLSVLSTAGVVIERLDNLASKDDIQRIEEAIREQDKRLRIDGDQFSRRLTVVEGQIQLMSGAYGSRPTPVAQSPQTTPIPSPTQ